MATTREIKNRIKSINDTSKITNAMYLISSTKLRKARKSVERTRPYFDLMKKEIRRMFTMKEDINSKYFREIDHSAGTCGIILITADRGLAGNYNQVLIKEALQLIERENAAKLYVIGEYGRNYMKSYGYALEDFKEVMREPSLDLARSITYRLLDDLNNGLIDRLYVCYADFENSISGCTASHRRLVPFDRRDREPEWEEDFNESATDFIYEPDPETVLEQIVESYITGYIYAALVNCFCAEQNSRMMAMDAANKNASELRDRLMLDYNHARQGIITQEITEISSGAKSLRNKKR